MKNVLSIIVPIFAIVVGIVLNFQQFLMGSPANFKNLMITLGYILTWILVLTINIKSNNRTILKYYSAFWLLTLLFASTTAFVNITEISMDWTIPFVILLLTQWYGIELLVDNYLITSLIIALLSFIIVILTIVCYRKHPKI